MQFEPWSASVLVSRASAGVAVGSIGPIPAGVIFRYVTIQPEVTISQNFNVAMVLAGVQARVAGDLANGTPVFLNMPTLLSAGVGGLEVQGFAGIPIVRRWQWSPRMLTGANWLNVGFVMIGTNRVSCVFGAVGFRRIKPVEDP